MDGGCTGLGVGGGEGAGDMTKKVEDEAILRRKIRAGREIGEGRGGGAGDGGKQ